jgi:hypothetical protein
LVFRHGLIYLAFGSQHRKRRRQGDAGGATMKPSVISGADDGRRLP